MREGKEKRKGKGGREIWGEGKYGHGIEGGTMYTETH